MTKNTDNQTAQFAGKAHFDALIAEYPTYDADDRLNANGWFKEGWNAATSEKAERGAQGLPPLPDLPEWSKRDDLGNLVPSEIRAGILHYARAYALSALAATSEKAERGAQGLPKPSEAMQQIDAVLEEYGWPSNTKNAARAGFEAARRMLNAAPPAAFAGFTVKVDPTLAPDEMRLVQPAPPTQPAQADEVDWSAVDAALFDVDDWVNRVNGDDRGTSVIVNTLRQSISGVRAALTPRPAAPLATDAGVIPARSHCQNGGDVCLAGNRDPRHVCCPEDSCDIDDGVRPNPFAAQPAAVEVQRPAPAEQPEREAVDSFKDSAEELREAADAFFAEGKRSGVQGAVRWVAYEDGALVIFTRGEYRDTLLSNIHAIPDTEHRFAATQAQPATADAIPAKVELAGLRGELRAAMGLVLSYIDEARGALDETYRFASTSPRAQQNINAAFEMLEEIERQAKPYTTDKAAGILPARSEEGGANA